MDPVVDGQSRYCAPALSALIIMEPRRVFSLQELRRFDGDQEPRMLVAYHGIVYDVTDCPKWRSGMHEGQHFPGQDLTYELDQNAPHAAEVFVHDCARQVGVLQIEAN